MSKLGLSLIVLLLFFCRGYPHAAFGEKTSIDTTPQQNSLYRIWKFKQFELVDNGVTMGMLEPYKIFNLTRRDTLIYNIQDAPDKFTTIRYKLSNNAIVLKGIGDGRYEYRILELTDKTLKLLVHVKRDNGDKEMDMDLVKIDFEAQ